jgi:hypothetical protein
MLPSFWNLRYQLSNESLKKVIKLKKIRSPKEEARRKKLCEDALKNTKLGDYKDLEE